MRALLQQKADVNAALVDGSTALHWAVESDDLETVDLLLHAGANPKAQDRWGRAPLWATIEIRDRDLGRNNGTTSTAGPAWT